MSKIKDLQRRKSQKSKRITGSMVREGLCALLPQLEKDVVVLQASDAEEGLALVAQPR